MKPTKAPAKCEYCGAIIIGSGVRIRFIGTFCTDEHAADYQEDTAP